MRDEEGRVVAQEEKSTSTSSKEKKMESITSQKVNPGYLFTLANASPSGQAVGKRSAHRTGNGRKPEMPRQSR